jgi:hypothetical protein
MSRSPSVSLLTKRSAAIHLLPRYRDIVGFCRRNMRFAPPATFGFVGEFAVDRSAKLPAAVDRDQ